MSKTHLSKTHLAKAHLPKAHLTALQSSEIEKRRRSKNWAIFLILLGLVALFYVITIVRIGARH